MKTLHLMRHAKSSWGDERLADFDRPLNDRGVKAAGFMGELIRGRESVPEMIICSPAVRAKRTAELVAAAAGIGGEIEYDDRIYEASPHRLAEVTASLDDKFGSVMLVGHNPGMEGLVYYLTGNLEPMPTAALAVIDLDIVSWRGVTGGCGQLREIIRPKDAMR